MSKRSHGTTALVLAGGVAKGAFEAGALEVLVERGIRIAQVVGASSGALNAIMLAAAIHAEREREAMERLVTLWREEADWMRGFNFTPIDALHGRGISDSSRALALMREEIPKVATAALHPVRLYLVTAAVEGVLKDLDDAPATTFEGVLCFDGADFDTDERRERIYTAAAASSAFPLLFHAVPVPGLGPCYDGGIINDTPLRLATDGGADRVIVIAPYPAVFRPSHRPNAVDFLIHLADILVHERLYRDLREAATTNRAIQNSRHSSSTSS
jgi:NTE family protein